MAMFLPGPGGPGTIWGSELADYRAYILDEDDHVGRAIGFVCPDDEAAKKYAQQFVDGHDVELWQGDRRAIANFW